MSMRKAFFSTIRFQRGLILLFIFLLFPGCGIGNRFVFNSFGTVNQTPDSVGLSFEEVWLKSADGLNIHGWYLPGDPNQPAVLYLHGNAANIAYRLDNLKHLNGLGFSTLIIDYRGFGRSDRDAWTEAGVYKDARAALRFLELKGWKVNNIIYYGRSLGAAAALQLAHERPPAGVVIEGAFTRLSDIAWRVSPIAYALFGWWLIDMEFDNLAKIDSIRTPLLVIHGEKDHIVPKFMGIALYQRAEEPKMLLLVEKAGHSNSFRVGGQPYDAAWQNLVARIRSRAKR